jgi:hypothetical protein
MRQRMMDCSSSKLIVVQPLLICLVGVRDLLQTKALVPFLPVMLGLWRGGALRWRSVSGTRWSAC